MIHCRGEGLNVSPSIDILNLIPLGIIITGSLQLGLKDDMLAVDYDSDVL